MSFRVYRSGLGNEYVYEGARPLSMSGVPEAIDETIVVKLATRSFTFTAKFYTQ